MSDLGPMSYFLGLEVKQSRGSLFVSQCRYAEELLKTTKMLHCKPIATPLNSNEKLHSMDNSGLADASRYRKIVGSLLYLTHTRPDLMFAISMISRFMQAPTVHHLGAVKRILHHVAGTLDYGLHYIHSNEFMLSGYTDSDWGGSPDDKKSTTGWVFMLGSAAVAWKSQKQPITAFSSTEAEYITATSVACEAVWIRRLLEDLNEKQDGPSIINCDNRSTIDLYHSKPCSTWPHQAYRHTVSLHSRSCEGGENRGSPLQH